MQERFLRWVLGVGRTKLGYMVREELQRGVMKRRTGMGPWGYESKLKDGGGEVGRWGRGENVLAGDGKEVEKGKGARGLGEGRQFFFEDKGWKVKEMETVRERGKLRVEEIVRRKRRRQEVESWRRIRESVSNKWYGIVKGVA